MRLSDLTQEQIERIFELYVEYVGLENKTADWYLTEKIGPWHIPTNTERTGELIGEAKRRNIEKLISDFEGVTAHERRIGSRYVPGESKIHFQQIGDDVIVWCNPNFHINLWEGPRYEEAKKASEQFKSAVSEYLSSFKDS